MLLLPSTHQACDDEQLWSHRDLELPSHGRDDPQCCGTDFDRDLDARFRGDEGRRTVLQGRTNDGHPERHLDLREGRQEAGLAEPNFRASISERGLLEETGYRVQTRPVRCVRYRAHHQWRGDERPALCLCLAAQSVHPDSGLRPR